MKTEEEIRQRYVELMFADITSDVDKVHDFIMARLQDDADVLDTEVLQRVIDLYENKSIHS